MVHRVPRVGGNVKSYMLAYDFNTTAYTRDPLDHFSLLKDIMMYKINILVINFVNYGTFPYPLEEKSGPMVTACSR